MTLFDECQEVLRANFDIVEEDDCEQVLDILNRYPLVKGNVVWSKVKYSDYESINALLKDNPISNDDVFVVADDVTVPIFRSKLFLIAEHIWDVTALSPKIFIFNDQVLIQPLFPTDMFRIGSSKDVAG